MFKRLRERLAEWWRRESAAVPRGYDVNEKGKDLARRNHYSDMSDKDYNARFHANDKRPNNGKPRG